MNNRLSFAQILQKKKSEESSKNSRISTNSRIAQSQFSNESQFPNLAQMMDQFLDPNCRNANFVLNLNQGELYQPNNQDFETGLNALDSFIMTKSYLNSQRNRPKNQPNQQGFGKNWNGPARVSNEFNLGQLSRKYVNVKQNQNTNHCNDNMFKFSTKTYQESLENSQRNHLDESNKYGSVSPSSYRRQASNNQMIGNTKIIQSQAYHNMPISESKNEQSVPRIEGSVKMYPKDDKKSRYQVNYQQTQRKQEPPKEKKKLILSKVRETQRSQEGYKRVEPMPIKQKIVKKLSEEQEFLLAGITSAPIVPQVPQAPVLSQNQKRIADAKKQISQMLQHRENIPVAGNNIRHVKPFIKSTSPITNQSVISENKKQQTKVVNYSFATNEQENMSQGPTDSLAPTKKQLKQIEQQRLIEENQKMLSCIEYTQSEADLDDDDSNGVMEYKRNVEASQSIPQRSLPHQEPREPYTLQKYIPHHEAIENPIQQEPTPSQPTEQFLFKNKPAFEVEQSEMIQRICVQPSIEESIEKYEINNSDHPNMVKKQSSESEIISERISEQSSKKQVYHDVSSIDIKLSDGGSEFCLKSQIPSKEDAMELPVGNAGDYQYSKNHHMIIPMLNVSDFESVSNNSLPSPKSSPQNSPLHENISHVDSNPPLSSENQSLNLHQQENYGFIYKMRMHSRNNSFTSNYNSSIHGSQNNESKNLCASSHSSLCIQGENRKDEDESVEGYNMSKYRLDNKKYDEVEVSVSMEIPKTQQQVNQPQQQIPPKQEPQSQNEIQIREPVITVTEAQSSQTVPSEQRAQKQDQHEEDHSKVNIIVEQSSQFTETIPQNLSNEQKDSPPILAEETVRYVEQKIQMPVIELEQPSKNQQSFAIDTKIVVDQPQILTLVEPEHSHTLEIDIVCSEQAVPQIYSAEPVENNEETVRQIENLTEIKINELQKIPQIESKNQDPEIEIKKNSLEKAPEQIPIIETPSLKQSLQINFVEAEQKILISEAEVKEIPKQQIKVEVKVEVKESLRGKLGDSIISKQNQEKPFSFNLDFLDF